VRRLSRRGFILLGGLAGAGGIAGAIRVLARPQERSPQTARAAATTLPARGQGAGTAAPPTTTTSAAAGHLSRWSDPRSWPHGVPGPGDRAVVTRPILLDTNARVAGVAILPGGRLVFDPVASRRLESTANVVVQGRLEMRPSSAAVSHRLVFVGVRERGFAGGGMDVLASDTGLWVVGDGRLDLAGTPRRAWTRAAGAVAAGATSIALRAEPDGWQAGDELVITPTLSPAERDSADAFDLVRVQAVSGRTVTLSGPVRYAHPAVAVGAGRTLTAEVLNLTRNVGIEGTPAGRAHIFIRSGRAQSIRAAAIRHMGPRKPDDESTSVVLGRYGLHFHMSGDGSRGSLVDGVVIRDTGSHAFVPHLSNGITFRDCISHDTFEEAYWWDAAPDTRTSGDPSDDILYDGCVASLVRHDPPSRGYRLAGFFIARGRGNAARNCVAVGVQGAKDAAGFIWPEGSEGVWSFRDCVAHNNDQHGIFTWQNTDLVHVISGFVGYHNVEAGIAHGAYANPYVYRDSILYGNGYAAVAVHATSRTEASSPLTFANLTCDGAGLSDHLVVSERHLAEMRVTTPTVFSGCSFTGARVGAFGWVYEGEDGPSNLELFSVLGCRFDGNEFWLADGILAGSRISVRDRIHGSLLLRRADQPGSLQPRWNARVTRA
jgi:G8 domain